VSAGAIENRENVVASEREAGQRPVREGIAFNKVVVSIAIVGHLTRHATHQKIWIGSS
jgi:hypothetical protein